MPSENYALYYIDLKSLIIWMNITYIIITNIWEIILFKPLLTWAFHVLGHYCRTLFNTIRKLSTAPDYWQLQIVFKFIDFAYSFAIRLHFMLWKYNTRALHNSRDYVNTVILYLFFDLLFLAFSADAMVMFGMDWISYNRWALK